jgi:hypothetical protein
MRVWNVTDGDGKRGRNKMVGQAVVRPGQYVNLPDSAVNGSKVQAEIRSGALFAGHLPPKPYLASKEPARASLKDGVKRSHGESAVEILSQAAEPIVTDDGLKVEETGHSDSGGGWKRRHK